MKFSTENDLESCILCFSKNHEFFFKDKFRDYRRCKRCSIIFVPREFQVSKKSEKERYDEHNNDPNDVRYRNFLERITVPIIEKFQVGAEGLDFGCGPTHLLADILRENNFKMEVYDPFYADDKSVLKKKYNFIVSTEVIEHLNNPLLEIKVLLSILKARGTLAIMTLPYETSIDFKTWHYKNDRTHIGFYSIETFDWLSKELHLNYSKIDKDIFVFDSKKV